MRYVRLLPESQVLCTDEDPLADLKDQDLNPNFYRPA